MLSTESDLKIIKSTIADNASLLLNKDIYIFGCIVQSRDIRDELLAHDCKLAGFIDNNPGKAGNGKMCLGVPVLFPVDLSVDDRVLIIICSKYFLEMKNQLEELGFCSANILRIPIDDDANKYSDDDLSVDNAKEIIEKGYELYERMIIENPNLDRLFLCPYPGTGDVYMACAYLPRYLENNRISDFILLVIGNACKRVAELFENLNVISITKEQSDELLHFWEFCGENTVLKPLLYWGWRTKKYLYADHYPQISFAEMFLYDVFEFESRPKITLPMQDEIDSVREAFNIAGLEEGKSVIIAPYAGSFISDISEQVWAKIVKTLQNKGFNVYTNCSNDQEKPIEGSTKVFFSYCQAIPFVELAGYFIGIRSGLCDVISSAKCRKVILYEDAFNATRISYFGLKKMGLCETDIAELDYSGWDDERIVSEIVEKLVGKQSNKEIDL